MVHYEQPKRFRGVNRKLEVEKKKKKRCWLDSPMKVCLSMFRHGRRRERRGEESREECDRNILKSKYN